jgi:hypothetical protein
MSEISGGGNSMNNEDFVVRESIDRLFALAALLEDKATQARETALNLQWTLNQHYAMVNLEQSLDDPRKISQFSNELDTFIARIEVTDTAEAIINEADPVAEMMRIWKRQRELGA